MLVIDRNKRDALRAKRRIGLRDHDHEVGVLAVGDEGFRAVEHIAVTAPHRRRAHALQIGPGARLRHGDSADDLALPHARQVTLALLFGAIGEDVGGYDI